MWLRPGWERGEGFGVGGCRFVWCRQCSWSFRAGAWGGREQVVQLTLQQEALPERVAVPGGGRDPDLDLSELFIRRPSGGVEWAVNVQGSPELEVGILESSSTQRV